MVPQIDIKDLKQPLTYYTTKLENRQIILIAFLAQSN